MTSGFGRASVSRSYPTQAARGPVSPSGSANTMSPNSSAPARNAVSVESTGRLPTSNSSLVSLEVISPPCRRDFCSRTQNPTEGLLEWITARPHGLAVRTPAFHAGNHRFESGWGYSLNRMRRGRPRSRLGPWTLPSACWSVPNSLETWRAGEGMRRPAPSPCRRAPRCIRGGDRARPRRTRHPAGRRQ